MFDHPNLIYWIFYNPNQRIGLSRSDAGLRSTLEPERNSTGLILGVVALLAIAGLAALLVVRREGATVATGLGAVSDVDAMAEATFAAEDKALPELQESAGATTWEENGVHWNRDAQGNLTYWDATSETWVPYQGLVNLPR